MSILYLSSFLSALLIIWLPPCALSLADLQLPVSVSPSCLDSWGKDWALRGISRGAGWRKGLTAGYIGWTASDSLVFFFLPLPSLFLSFCPFLYSFFHHFPSFLPPSKLKSYLLLCFFFFFFVKQDIFSFFFFTDPNSRSLLPYRDRDQWPLLLALMSSYKNFVWLCFIPDSEWLAL